MTGKVYFVAAPGRIKIGFTTKPEARLTQLRRMDMEELTVIATVDGSKHDEKRLHELVDAHRIKGEWFTDCPEVRAVVDAFISGQTTFDADASHGSVAGQQAAANYLADRRDEQDATASEIKSLLSEIEARAARKENVSDLVRSACFLAKNFIAPRKGALRGLDRT